MKQIDIATEFAYPIRHGVPPRRRQASDCTMTVTVGAYRVSRHGKLWELRDAAGELVCLTAYKKGAIEVVRRLSAVPSPGGILGP
jgi:hypothetical protein